MKRFFLFMLILMSSFCLFSCHKDKNEPILEETPVPTETVSLTHAIVGTYIGNSLTTSEKENPKNEVTQVIVESVGEEKVSLTLKRVASGVNREDIEEIAEVNVSLEDEEYKLSAIDITSDGVRFEVNGTVNGKDIQLKIIYHRDGNKTISDVTGVRK